MIDPMVMQQIMANQQRMQQFQQQFSQFAQQFQSGPQMMNGQQQVQQMLARGEMSQADFEQCRQWANMMTGMNY
jgi:truncated hemoglobin YjbI